MSVQTRWIGTDLPKRMSPLQIHSLLSEALLQWDRRLGVRAYSVPDPVDFKSTSDEKRVLRQARSIAIKEAVRSSFPISIEGHCHSQEGMLMVAVLRRALHDYLRGICSSYSADQRLALDAYWWVMDFGCHVVDSQTAKDELESLHLRIKQCEDPFVALRVSRARFGHDYRITDKYNIPRIDHVHSLPKQTIASFPVLCGLLNIDADSVRRCMHLQDPLPPVSAERRRAFADDLDLDFEE